MRTLVHFVRHGGYSDSEMIALGWGATVFIPGLFAAAGLLMLIAWVLVLITEMLVGERSLAFYYLVTIPIFVFAAGIAILAVSACRQWASGRDDRQAPWTDCRDRMPDEE